MAYDKVVDSAALDAGLTKISDAIRGKAGTSGKLEFPDGMEAAINAIEVGISEVGELGTPTVNSAGLVTAQVTKGGILEAGKSTTLQLSTQAAKTVTPSTSAQTAVAAGKYTTGAVTVAAMATATQATPSITVSNAGLITASATQTAGYVSAGTKSATQQLTVQAAKTVTPSASAQTAVAAGRYTTGAVTVAAIPSTYKNMATGTLSGSDNTLQVTGLNFTPTHVAVVGQIPDGSYGIVAAYDAYGVFGGSDGAYYVSVTCTFSSGSFQLYNASNKWIPCTYRWVAWA